MQLVCETGFQASLCSSHHGTLHICMSGRCAHSPVAHLTVRWIRYQSHRKPSNAQLCVHLRIGVRVTASDASQRRADIQVMTTRRSSRTERLSRLRKHDQKPCMEVALGTLPIFPTFGPTSCYNSELTKTRSKRSTLPFSSQHAYMQTLGSVTRSRMFSTSTSRLLVRVCVWSSRRWSRCFYR
jgi:hypothetical protein